MGKWPVPGVVIKGWWFLLLTGGCATPQSSPPDGLAKDAAQLRSQALLPSAIGGPPRSTGLDPRARDIERSLGLP
jgi:hypothetical protein